MNSKNLNQVGIGQVCSYFKVLTLIMALTYGTSFSVNAQIDVEIDILIGLAPGGNPNDPAQVNPNPFFSYVQIWHQQSTELYSLQIMNKSGEVVEDVSLVNQSSVNVSLEPGTYFFLINTSAGLVTKQVVMLE